MTRSGKAFTAVVLSLCMVASALVVLTMAGGTAVGPTRGTAGAPTTPALASAGNPAPSGTGGATFGPDPLPPCTVTVSKENSGKDALQTVLDAVPANSVVCVAAGTWPEQVTISTPGLTLRGVGNGTGGTILEPTTLTLNTYDYDSSAGATGTPTAAIILIEGTSGDPTTGVTGVTIENLQVNGLAGATSSVFSGCSDGFVGVDFQASSGTIFGTTVTRIELPSGLFGCQQGLAVYAYDGHFNYPGANAPDAVAITNSTVSAYDKNGVTCDDLGVTCTITNDRVTGIGPTTSIAQNGIQVAYGASATATLNRVTGNAYTPTNNVNYFSANEGNAACGILAFDAGNTVVIDSNVLSGNTQGISVVGTPTSTVSANTVREADAYGITFDLNASAAYLYGLPIFSTATPWQATASGNVLRNVNVGILTYDDNVSISGGSTHNVNVSVESMDDHAGSTFTVSVTGMTATANVSGFLLGNLSSYQPPEAGFFPKAIGVFATLDNHLSAGSLAYPAGSQYGIVFSGSSVSSSSDTVTGFDVGVYVDPTPTASVEGDTISVTSALGAPGIGIWAGNGMAVDPDTHEPTGTYVITGNTVTGPGGGAYTSPEAGSVGIQTAGAALNVADNTVSGFSDAAGSSAGETGYNWYEGTQSVAIMAACAPAAGPSACSVSDNVLSDNVIGIVNLLWNAGFVGVYQTGPMTISGNTITDSLGYGIFQEWTNDALTSGPVLITGNTLDNSLSGAPGMVLGGATFFLDNNILIGASNGGSQGASEGNWVGGPLPTASIAIVTGGEGTTDAVLSGNAFLDTTLYTTYLPGSGSTFSPGELVTFTESGLPLGTTWSVTMNGTTATSLGTYATAQDAIVFQFPTSPHGVGYSIGAVAGYFEASIAPVGTLLVPGAPLSESVVFLVPSAGQVVIGAGGTSSDPSLVSVSGTTATVQASFSGNITDLFRDSTLDGAGFTVNALAYPGDANVIGIAANEIIVEYVDTVSSGSTTGIQVGGSVFLATIVYNTVSVTSATGFPGIGIWAGNALAANPDEHEPTGNYWITNNLVTGPGGGAYSSPGAGSIGILTAAASLTVDYNVVTGFSAAAGSPSGSTGYDWFQGTQSLGIDAACRPGSGEGQCSVKWNHLSNNVIGIVDLLWSAGFGGVYQTGPMTISGNAINDSYGYGIYDESTNDGLASTGTTDIVGNTINNVATGALGMVLSGATFSILGNTLIGTSPTGDQGAVEVWEGGPGLPTSSIVITDDGAGLTHAVLNGNAFLDTSVYYTFYTYGSGSTFSGGELVTFTETGLTSGTTWSVTMNGTTGVSLGTYTTEQDAVVFQFQNSTSPYGPYPFSVAPVGGFNATPASGSISVAGTAVHQLEVFAPALFAITFSETGILPKVLGKSGWTVALDGTTKHTTASSVTFAHQIGGPYLVLITGPNHNVVRSTTGLSGTNPDTLSIAGTTSVAVVFGSGKTLTLTFHEKGFPSGKSWCVSLDSSKLCSAKSTQKFVDLTPGTYDYAVVVPAHNATVTLGKTSEPTSGPITLSKNVKLNVAYLYTYKVTFTESGLPSELSWSVKIGKLTRSNATGDPIVFRLGNGTYSYKAGPEPGYKAVGSPSKAVVNGAAVKVTVTYSVSGHLPLRSSQGTLLAQQPRLGLPTAVGALPGVGLAIAALVGLLGLAWAIRRPDGGS